MSPTVLQGSRKTLPRAINKKSLKKLKAPLPASNVLQSEDLSKLSIVQSMALQGLGASSRGENSQ